MASTDGLPWFEKHKKILTDVSSINNSIATREALRTSQAKIRADEFSVKQRSENAALANVLGEMTADLKSKVAVF
jgi:hypothetical protein